MKLDSEIAIKQYYEEVKHLYPHVTFDQFKEVCKAPFDYTKVQMASGELPVIRLKYLGTFLVYPKRAEAFLRRLTERFKYHKIDRTYFFKVKSMIDSFLERNGTSK